MPQRNIKSFFTRAPRQGAGKKRSVDATAEEEGRKKIPKQETKSERKTGASSSNPIDLSASPQVVKKTTKKPSPTTTPGSINPVQQSKTPTTQSPQKISKRKPKKTPGSGKPDLSDDTQKAIAAVKEAAKKLPPESEVKFSLGEGGQWQGGGDAVPPNKGNKELPRGHPGCLTGLTFVISGTLDSLEREEAENLIKGHGGRTTSAVSGRTSFLVCGENCGHSKHRVAKEKGTKIIDEDGLFALIKAAPLPDVDDEDDVMDDVIQTVSAPPNNSGAVRKSSWAPPPRPSKTKSTTPTPSAPSQTVSVDDNRMWVDKYQPQRIADLIGNNQSIENLRQWLEMWERVHRKGETPEKKSGGFRKVVDFSKKAALLSGRPGVGKTSTAVIVARSLGFNFSVYNASDTRNKSDAGAKKGMSGKLSNVIKENSGNSVIRFDGSTSRKTLIIMDEVDGMSGGDRGGVTDLIDTIKKAAVPMICICNDKYNQKLRSLKGHCMELDFAKPRTPQIQKRVEDICNMEGLRFENGAVLPQLINDCNGDIRTVLNRLQMAKQGQDLLRFSDLKDGKIFGERDVDVSCFEAAGAMLGIDKRPSLGEQAGMVMDDMDLVPLLIQENYLHHVPGIAKGDRLTHMKCIAKAAGFIAMGDVINSHIRRDQEWSLMPSCAMMGSVAPATYMKGPRQVFKQGEMNFTKFTQYLGHQSTKGKQFRLLDELNTKMMAGGHTFMGRDSTITDYASVLKRLLLAPLQKKGMDGIPETIQLMHDYCLSKDDFDFLMEVTTWKSAGAWNEDQYKALPAQLKSALTREFNKSAKPIRSNIQDMDITKGAKKSKKATGKSVKGEGDEAMDDEGGEEQSEQEEEEETKADPEKLRKSLKTSGISLEVKNSGGKGKQGRGGRASKASGKSGRGRGGRGSSSKKRKA